MKTIATYPLLAELSLDILQVNSFWDNVYVKYSNDDKVFIIGYEFDEDGRAYFELHDTRFYIDEFMTVT